MIGDVSWEYIFLCLRFTPWVRSCSSQNPVIPIKANELSNNNFWYPNHAKRGQAVTYQFMKYQFNFSTLSMIYLIVFVLYFHIYIYMYIYISSLTIFLHHLNAYFCHFGDNFFSGWLTFFWHFPTNKPSPLATIHLLAILRCHLSLEDFRKTLSSTTSLRNSCGCLVSERAQIKSSDHPMETGGFYGGS